MFRSLLIAVAVLILSAPVAAQQQLWSATMTVEETVSPAVPGVGYHDMTAGELSDRDFDFRGTTHTILFFVQRTSGSFTIGLQPAIDEDDLDSLTFTAGDHSLAGSDRDWVSPGPDGQIQISWAGDPGFRWTVGQRITVGLTTSQQVPVLPLAGAGLLALLLGVGAYRRVARRS
jgi:hypothetical protein